MYIRFVYCAFSYSTDYKLLSKFQYTVFPKWFLYPPVDGNSVNTYYSRKRAGLVRDIINQIISFAVLPGTLCCFNT